MRHFRRCNLQQRKGKTLPFNTCGFSRRNKNCTRSVKKKSGPAKGTKYAARRARPHEETQQPRGKQNDLSSSSSGNRGGGGGGVVSPNVGRISGSGSGGGGSTVAGVLTHNTPGGLSSLALNSQQRRPTPSSAGGRSRELPPSSSAATCRGGLASPSRGSSAVITPLGYPQVVGPGAGGAGVENSGMGGELGIAIPQQHHSGGGVGGADIESQQLISTFPGVLQVCTLDLE